MILFRKERDLHNYLETVRNGTGSIGFVPTMGALHAGHQYLVKEAIQSNTTTVCSIFVNPAQFNDPRDFEKYPITLEKDINLLEKTGCNVLFIPAVSEIYPDGISGKMEYDLGSIGKVLEGKYRPGHFQGVCKVMDRLLTIVMPDRLYMGQKDYQQCRVIEKLINLLNLKQEIKLVPCPTLREADGLAMSSRNVRLSPQARAIAPAIYQCLQQMKRQLANEEIKEVETEGVKFLQDKGFRVDYVSIVNAVDLQAPNPDQQHSSLIGLVAAFLGEIRLIDNLLLNE